MGKNEETVTKIIAIIDKIRPFLISDGGNLEFVKYEDNIVYIKFLGACMNCLYSDDTLENGIFETIKEAVPEIDRVVKVDL
jgi:Fe-S cluster biogenesis protein NfuA